MTLDVRWEIAGIPANLLTSHGGASDRRGCRTRRMDAWRLMLTTAPNVLIESSRAEAEAILLAVKPNCRKPFADWSLAF